jgi:hypothetical protein
MSALVPNPDNIRLAMLGMTDGNGHPGATCLATGIQWKTSVLHRVHRSARVHQGQRTVRCRSARAGRSTNAVTDEEIPADETWRVNGTCSRVLTPVLTSVLSSCRKPQTTVVHH